MKSLLFIFCLILEDILAEDCFKNNLRIKGKRLNGEKIKKNSAAECFSLCEATEGCLGMVYNTEKYHKKKLSKRCFMYKTIKKTGKAKNTVSAVVKNCLETSGITTLTPTTKRSSKKGIVIPAWPRHKTGDFESFSTVSWWYNYHTYQDPIGSSKWWCTDYGKYALSNRTACFPEHGEEEWEYVPMVRGLKGRGYKPERFDADPSPAVENSPFVLGFNEPNMHDQSNLEPKEAAEAWIDHQNNYPEKTLVSPATGNADTEWYDQFHQNCKDLSCRIDYISTHLYSGTPNERMAELEAYSMRYGKKLWLTEFALAKNQNETEVVEFIKEILPMLECADFIYRYAWWYTRYYEDDPTSLENAPKWKFYVSAVNSLLDVSGESSSLTPAGEAYDFPYHNQPCTKTSGWYDGTNV